MPLRLLFKLALIGRRETPGENIPGLGLDRCLYRQIVPVLLQRMLGKLADVGIIVVPHQPQPFLTGRVILVQLAQQAYTGDSLRGSEIRGRLHLGIGEMVGLAQAVGGHKGKEVSVSGGLPVEGTGLVRLVQFFQCPGAPVEPARILLFAIR